MTEVIKTPIPVEGYDEQTARRILTAHREFLTGNPQGVSLNPQNFSLALVVNFLGGIDRLEETYRQVDDETKPYWLMRRVVTGISYHKLRAAFVTPSYMLFIANCFPFGKISNWRDGVAKLAGIDVENCDPGIFDPRRGKEVESEVMRMAAEDWATPDYIKAMDDHMATLITNERIRRSQSDQVLVDMGYGRKMRTWVEDFRRMYGGEDPGVRPQLTRFTPY